MKNAGQLEFHQVLSDSLLVLRMWRISLRILNRLWGRPDYQATVAGRPSTGRPRGSPLHIQRYTRCEVSHIESVFSCIDKLNTIPNNGWVERLSEGKFFGLISSIRRSYRMVGSYHEYKSKSY